MLMCFQTEDRGVNEIATSWIPDFDYVKDLYTRKEEGEFSKKEKDYMSKVAKWERTLANEMGNALSLEITKGKSPDEQIKILGGAEKRMEKMVGAEWAPLRKADSYDDLVDRTDGVLLPYLKSSVEDVMSSDYIKKERAKTGRSKISGAAAHSAAELEGSDIPLTNTWQANEFLSYTSPNIMRMVKLAGLIEKTEQKEISPKYAKQLQGHKDNILHEYNDKLLPHILNERLSHYSSIMTGQEQKRDPYRLLG